MRKQVNKKTVVAPTVFFDSNGESSFTFILDKSRAFLAQEVASLKFIILPKMPFSNKANYLPLGEILLLQNLFGLGSLA